MCLYLPTPAWRHRHTDNPGDRASPSVNVQTRRRIEEIAHKLDYTLDKNAAGLAGRTSGRR
jgi:hypothetical protein